MKNFIFPQERELAILCASPELRDVLFSADHIKGLIFAVAAAPEIPLPDSWLPWVFKRHGQLKSTAQADKLTALLMGMLQQQLGLMRDERVDLPGNCNLPENYQSPLVNEQALCQWLSGLLAGHSRLDGVWQKAWQRMLHKNPQATPGATKTLTHCLTMFTTFADIPLAIEQSTERGHRPKFEKMLASVYRSLPVVLGQYVTLSGELVAYLPNQFESFVQNDKQP